MSDQQPKTSAVIEGRFRLLRQMVLDAASGVHVRELIAAALEQSLVLSGVEAGVATLWGEREADTWSATAGEDGCVAHLVGLERILLGELRTRHGVRSLYMTIDREGGPAGVFTYPLCAGGTIYGAISGYARGERNLAIEEEFISGFAAIIALAVKGQGRRDEPAAEALRKAREAAIAETAVTINHEINNPLTAISGNLQLLFSRAQDLSPDVVRLLKKIEEGADRILEVTRKLRNLTADKTVPYLGDTKMIDLDASSEPPRKDTL